MSRQVSRGSVSEYQADEQAGVARLRSQVAGRWAGRCRGAQLASIRQKSRQLSRGSAGKYQAYDQAGVARLRWRVFLISLPRLLPLLLLLGNMLLFFLCLIFCCAFFSETKWVIQV